MTMTQEQAQGMVVTLAQNLRKIETLKADKERLGAQLMSLQRDPVKFKAQRADILARIKTTDTEINRLEATLRR